MFNSNEFKKIILIFTAIFFINSCAGIVGGKIDLEDYPKIDKDKNYPDLSYKYEDNPGNWLYFPKSGFVFGLKNEKLHYEQKKPTKKCNLKIKTYSTNSFFSCPIITNILSPYTLAIIPYYCRDTYHLEATLQTNPKDGSNPKILKTYDLSENMHEVWSSLHFLFILAFPKFDTLTPESATAVVTNKIATAFTNQVLNDALEFKECRK